MVAPLLKQTGDAIHRLSLEHVTLDDPAHIFFISDPQVHLPEFWLIVPHLHSGKQLQTHFPMVLKDLSFCHPSALKSAFPFSTFTTFAFTMSLPQGLLPGFMEIVLQAHFSPQLQSGLSYKEGESI
jgi:hypothetical protein